MECARQVAKIIFGQPVDLSSYKERYESDPSSVARNLTECLHREVSALRAELSGMPNECLNSKEKPNRCWAQQIDRVA